MDPKAANSLLSRLAADGKPETLEEIEFLNDLANRFNQHLPQHACPYCWLQRELNNTKEKINGRQV